MFFKIISLFLLPLLFYTNTFSQDIKFSQYYNNPLHLNSALAGFSTSGRVVLNYRNQWTGLQNAYNSFSVSYDKIVNKVSGIGFVAAGDVQGNGIYKQNSLSAIYSHKAKFSPKLYVAFGIQGTYSQRKIDGSKVVTASMINPFSGNINNTLSNNIFPISNILDLSSGITFWSKNIYFGIAAHHIAKVVTATDNFMYNQLSPKYTSYFGITIALDDRGLIKNKLYLSPDIIFQYQGGHNQISYGGKLRYEKLYTAIHIVQDLVLNFDTADLIIGFTNRNLKFAYSYDFTLSKLFMTATSSHELSLMLLLGNGLNFRQSKAIRCPSI